MRFLSIVLLFSAHMLAPALAAESPLFAKLAEFKIDKGNSEIVAALPGGMALVSTNADNGSVDFIDISNPAAPSMIEQLSMKPLSNGHNAEPTSIAVTPNGKFALVTVKDKSDNPADQSNGELRFIDLESRAVITAIDMGIGPDCVAVSPDGKFAVVAVEDEETEGRPGARPGYVMLIAIDYDNPTGSKAKRIDIDLSGAKGTHYISDPQPEYVDISQNSMLAVVTLQENNAIALIDIDKAKVVRVFSAGIVERKADTHDDAKIDFSDNFIGRREPDGVKFTLDAKHIITANEGDTNKENFDLKKGEYSGGRGFSIFTLDGRVIFDSGLELERAAAKRGLYPDNRSGKRSIEMEGIETAVFGGITYVFAASERGDFIAVYDISDLSDAKLVDLLPTAKGPEGIIAIPARGLLISANEKAGSITMFGYAGGRGN